MKHAGKEVDDEALQHALKESEGIGTEATRASIIETLKRQMYIDVGKNQVTILDKGKILCQAIGTLLASPEMTAKRETYLKEIGKNEGSQELLAHAKLHSSAENRMSLSSEEKEFQAEMTAYAVASYFDIDTSDYSLGYLANWTQGKELQDKEKLLEEVRMASVEFIEIMEPELMKDQSKNLAIGKDVFLQTIQDRNDTSELVGVNQEAMDYIIDHMEEEHTKGLYYCMDGDIVIGVDNSTNEAWTEESDHVVKCKAWLKRYDLDIEKPQMFIEESEAPELE